jgi:hypothetical protein
MKKKKKIDAKRRELNSVQLPFLTKYARPSKFSNPYNHFSTKELSIILKKADDELEWYDFAKIFHFETPAGTYQEIVYFLPWVLRYFEMHAYNSREFFGNLLYFIASEEKQLREERLFTSCIDSLYSAFKNWTSTFKVVHYDKEACRKKGWGLEYDDVVERCEVVFEFIDDLCYEENLSFLATDLVKFLADVTNEPVRSAWFLEYVYRNRKYYGFYSDENIQALKQKMKKDIGLGDDFDPPELDMTPTKKNPEISKIVFDSGLIKRHYLKIKDSIIKEEKSPTYWKDLITYLHIE